MSIANQVMKMKQASQEHTAGSLDPRRTDRGRTVATMARRSLAIGALLTATLGFVGTPGASAYTDCNTLFRSGHGYYGCNDIDHAWDHGTWRSVVYFW